MSYFHSMNSNSLQKLVGDTDIYLLDQIKMTAYPIAYFIHRQKSVNLIKAINSMTTTIIRKKLVDYLKVADDKKVKAIYTMVEDEINTAENDWDKNFVKELNRRSRQFKNGKSKTYTWEETKKAAIEKVKAKRK